ncbi:hypothetical protein ANN_22286 [Periplaneta americana]|uniref:Uncharacterized protein n=1 Tax=Periplaneta americana TaxID=6978 RepID=A0ABQ8S7P7_PERAM|nr:hypothetical protein ANN_22286 [Periplaneta americana]
MLERNFGSVGKRLSRLSFAGLSDVLDFPELYRILMVRPVMSKQAHFSDLDVVREHQALGLALRNARWFESSRGKTFSHEFSASVWDRCPPSIVMHLVSYDWCFLSTLILYRILNQENGIEEKERPREGQEGKRPPA